VIHQGEYRGSLTLAVLDDPLTAFLDIDRCLRAARQYSKPVYLELPRDQLDYQDYPIPASVSIQHESDAGALSEAVGETEELLEKAGRPVILAGVEVHRPGAGLAGTCRSGLCYS
jgi:indolepyruvate decarboxylase